VGLFEKKLNYVIIGSLNFEMSIEIREKYDELVQIGAGTYGKVYKARDRRTGEYVAIKMVSLESGDEGFPVPLLREIKILTRLRHSNVIGLKEVAFKDNEVALVFDYMENDLMAVIHSIENQFTPPQVKCYLKQILEGVYYIHSQGVLHRDLKGANLLLNHRGELKICDFGHAVERTRKSAGTNNVVTLWYRAPELLLGCTYYGFEIDTWSIGCIFYELLTRNVLFPGNNAREQMENIFKLCGTPNEQNFPGISELPEYNTLVNFPKYERKLRETFQRARFSEEEIDFLDKCLTLHPDSRPTIESLLDCDYLWNDPLPMKPIELPQYHPVHEFEAKKTMPAYGTKKKRDFTTAELQPQHSNPQQYKRFKPSNNQNTIYPSQHIPPPQQGMNFKRALVTQKTLKNVPLQKQINQNPPPQQITQPHYFKPYDPQIQPHYNQNIQKNPYPQQLPPQVLPQNGHTNMPSTQPYPQNNTNNNKNKPQSINRNTNLLAASQVNNQQQQLPNGQHH